MSTQLRFLDPYLSLSHTKIPYGVDLLNFSRYTSHTIFQAEVAELVDAPDSKSGDGDIVGVRVPPSVFYLAFL
jgi:hypothetical protein